MATRIFVGTFDSERRSCKWKLLLVFQELPGDDLKLFTTRPYKLGHGEWQWNDNGPTPQSGDVYYAQAKERLRCAPDRSDSFVYE
jgi:hypothetical protein